MKENKKIVLRDTMYNVDSTSMTAVMLTTTTTKTGRNTSVRHKPKVNSTTTISST